ncbi:MAG: hypothetical protein CMI02_10775 [Oceanospirillaceae bacterium]|nr:hypothetical protein [Oceanospirillaceae bacterium]
MIFGIVSLIPCVRTHSLKLLALMIVSGLCLFANQPTTYFAALFIVATAVTELEFLQNLAAIIRGNKDYFSYKIEALSSEEKKEKIAKEQNIDLDSLTEDEKEKITKGYISDKTKNGIRRAYEVEEKALDEMEKYFGKEIKRNVRIKSKMGSLELDGLIPSVVDDMISEKIIEIKYLSDPRKFDFMHKQFSSAEHVARTYCNITNKIAKMHLVLVVEGDNGLTEKQTERLKSLVDNSSVSIGYSVFTTKQLGI